MNAPLAKLVFLDNRALAPEVPAYLEKYYWWAYLRPAALRVFDHTPVVSAILWGQYGRLKRAMLDEIGVGQRVLQAACVYGDFSCDLSRRVGLAGHLDVIDVAPIQLENCRHKLRGFPQTTTRLADAAAPGGEPYDAVCCYFLLHELPDDHKRAVVDALLERVVPGGKVIFLDYHKPHWAHPLKPVTSLVFDTLEPFAKGLWRNEIADFSQNAGLFSWRKETYFGGLFQKVVVQRQGEEREWK
jgi:ubiquinone/menaquinone biosynthesis C-methylase UbiE